MLYFHTALFDSVHPRLLTQKRIFPPRAAPARGGNIFYLYKLTDCLLEKIEVVRNPHLYFFAVDVKNIE